MAHVDAVGYGLVGLNVNIAEAYPNGGMQSAPRGHAGVTAVAGNIIFFVTLLLYHP